MGVVMAKEELSVPGTLVKKSNSIIRTRITVKSVEASRIWHILLPVFVPMMKSCNRRTLWRPRILSPTSAAKTTNASKEPVRS